MMNIPMKFARSCFWSLTINGSKAIKAQDYEEFIFQRKIAKKKRPLGIPTIKDRIVQDLYQIFIDPIIEAKSDPNSFGFRKGRDAHLALGAIGRRLIQKEKSGRKE